MIYDLTEEEVKTIVDALEDKKDALSASPSYEELFLKIIAYLESKLEKK